MALVSSTGDVVSCINQVILPIERTKDLASDISESTDLPDAFLVVARVLPLVHNVLTYMKKTLSRRGRSPGGETREDRQSNISIIEMANCACNWAHALERIFSAVLLTDGNLQQKLDRYRSVARHEPLEVVMERLLSGLVGVATTALVGEEYVAQLRDALGEVKQLPASLEEDKKSHHFVNSGPGNQFNHIGNGNINPNFGNGPQITGDATHATMNFGAPPAQT